MLDSYLLTVLCVIYYNNFSVGFVLSLESFKQEFFFDLNFELQKVNKIENLGSYLNEKRSY